MVEAWRMGLTCMMSVLPICIFCCGSAMILASHMFFRWLGPPSVSSTYEPITQLTGEAGPPLAYVAYKKHATRIAN